MPKLNLTDLTVKNLRVPDSGQVAYWDANLPGFGIRVSTGGTKSFVLMVGDRNSRKRITLGRYPILSLAEARVKAKEVLANITLGNYDRPQNTSCHLVQRHR